MSEQGSNDGEEYETITTLGEEPPQGYTTLDIDEQVPLYRFVRYVGPPNSNCRLAELELHGILYSLEPENGSCNVHCQVGELPVDSLRVFEIQQGFTYSPSLTPNVTNLTPSMGTTAGGTTISIEGSGFGTEVKFEPLYLYPMHREINSAGFGKCIQIMAVPGCGIAC